jgi:hypothetical protein
MDLAAGSEAAHDLTLQPLQQLRHGVMIAQ